jgi:hypothetical protein
MADRAGLKGHRDEAEERAMSRQRKNREQVNARTGHGYVEFLLVMIVVAAVACAVTLIVQWYRARENRREQAIWYEEVSKLYDGVADFREKFSQTPPNFHDKDELKRFVAKAFPQYQQGVSAPYPEDFDAAQALVFWLSGISTDPADPFAPNAKDRHLFFELPKGRIRDGRLYASDDEAAQPYVYFACTGYDGAEYRGLRPYQRHPLKGGAKEYFAPETAQIICAGRDHEFGRGGLFTELSEEDRDNVVSFSTLRVGQIALSE